MSDPAVNAQLDGIISDFEGGCRAGCGTAWRPLGQEGCGKGEAGPPMGRPPAARPASPTWRTAAASFLPFIVVCVCRTRTASSRAPGASAKPPERSFPLSRRSAPSLPRFGSAFGPLSPAASQGVGYSPLRPAWEDSPLPHTSFGLGLSGIRARVGCRVETARPTVGSWAGGGLPLAPIQAWEHPQTPSRVRLYREGGVCVWIGSAFWSPPPLGVYKVWRDFGGLLPASAVLHPCPGPVCARAFMPSRDCLWLCVLRPGE